MKYFLLIDWPARTNKFWLAAELENLGCDLTVLGIQNYNSKNAIIRWRKILLWFQYVQLSMRAIRQSNNGDIIISWNFVVGAIAGFLNRFLHTKRKILSLNMIVHQKHSINSVMRNFMYRYVLGSEEFIVTLNADALVDLYKHLYNIPIKNFAQLPDALFDTYEDIPFDEGNGTIFSGGEASRDWKTLLEVAAMNPGFQFRIIARKKYFPQEIQIPPNVEVSFDTTEDTFYNVLKTCSIVALPLTSIAPSGLIVLLRAAMLSRPIITTSTPSVRNYIIHKKTGVLVPPGDAKTFSDELNILYHSPEIRRMHAVECKQFIKANFIPQKYAERIISILDSKQWTR
jgi:glycosyltransferase involved in cell wall biosynthesis